MENFTSIIIRKKANSVWTLEDNEGGEHYSNTYSGTRDNTLITIKTKTGGIIYNQQPWSVFSYIDEMDAGNSFTPSSAQQLVTNLEVRGFFAEGINGGGGVDTFLELLDVLVPTYTGNGGKYIGINDDETGLIVYDPQNVDQNNKPRYFIYNFTDDGLPVTAADVSTKVNNPSFLSSAISATDTPVVILANKGNKTYMFLFKKGKGAFGGSGAGSTLSTDFRLISVLYTTPEDIENDPNAVIIPLVGVVGGDFLATANLTEWDFIDSGEQQSDGGFKTYYFSYTDDGVEYFVRFIGTAGIYGGGIEPDFVEADFTDATNSDIPPADSLQSVTQVGAITNIPITIGNTGQNILLEKNQIKYFNEPFSTTVNFTQPSGDNVATFPDKSGTVAFTNDITALSLSFMKIITVANTIQDNRLIGLDITDTPFPFAIAADNSFWTEFSDTSIFPDIAYDPITGTITDFYVGVGKKVVIHILI